MIDLDHERPQWYDRAACNPRPAGADWYALYTRGPNAPPPELLRAIEICTTSCPVRGECLDYGIAHPSEVGIWGGLNDDERRSIRTGRPHEYEARLTRARAHQRERNDTLKKAYEERIAWGIAWRQRQAAS